MTKDTVITLDGPSGAGKSTVARELARRLGYRYLDTGAMYRAVALAVVRAGLRVEPIDEEGVARLVQNLDIALRSDGEVLIGGRPAGVEIRGNAVTEAVSAVAALPAVRARMVAVQREFGRGGRLVADGRDLGSVVFPEALHRFYLDADPVERARRRARQQSEQGLRTGSEAAVLEEQAERDRKDSGRALAPLVKAPGVEVIDTTALSAAEVVGLLLDRLCRHRSGGGR